ncbi:DDE-domain-containing protein [Aulographum hederae CBS 113979]|uniref:DDE-domain-containing protein n=1 Tax=Aulographum hederae CBS 113979 TaxID=1176131 RepID=A0A6G1GQQ0_9PEZI|nr:DDE-domain-containing protein [Aulographum hederae CBS 113979]
MAKDNKVFILYLPAHTSHILQPLDLGVFGPLKTKYSQQLQKLATFTDGTDIKKNMFLALYKQARIEGLTSSNIKTGFRTTGIWPFNPRKVLKSSQLNANAGNDTTEVFQSSSPLRLSKIHHTPQKPSDISTLIDTLDSRSSRIDFSAVKRKIVKYAASQSTQIATLEHESAKQISEIARLRPVKRRRITIDPQKAFADIGDVLVASTSLDEESEQQNDASNATRVSTRKKIKSARQVAMEELDVSISE